MLHYEIEGNQITATLEEPRTVTRHASEVAAWYDTLELEPGTYPVELTDIRHNPVPFERAYYAFIRIPARVVVRYAPSLFGGVVVGNATPQEVDEVTTHTIVLYGYQLRRLLEDDPRLAEVTS